MKAKTKYLRYSGEKNYHLRRPEGFKHQLVCVYCSEIFGAHRSNAKTCSSQCRQAEYRYQKDRRENALS